MIAFFIKLIMRYLTCFMLIILLLIGSCTKEQKAPPELSGNWRWKISYGYQSIADKTPENTGIEKLLVLSEDFKWEKLENNSLISSGRFSVGHGTYINYFRNLSYDSIVLHKPGEIKITDWDYYEVDADTLTFCACFAGYTGMKTIYVRQVQ